MILEPRHTPTPGFRAIAASFAPVHAANAVIAFIFAASAPVAIVLGVGLKNGLDEADMASWIFAAFFLNGLMSVALSIFYRTPLVFFWTIPGTVLVGPALGHLSFPEVIGAFYGTGILLLVLGLTGSVRKIMSYLPMPIIMAMVAGVFLQFGLDWITAFRDDFWLVALMTAVYAVLSMTPALGRRVPPMIGVLVAGGLAVALMGGGETPAPLFGAGTRMLAAPVFFAPVFSLQAMIELVVPLAITVLAAQNAQGIAILQTTGHKPPINTITTACGGASLVTAVFGAVSTCLTGPVNAVLSSGGETRDQYAGAIMVGVLGMLFGLYAPLFTHLMLATPPAFIATLAGLALLRVLQNAFAVSFGGRFALGALISFMVTVGGQAIFNIGAPFWGLVFGFLASWLLERDDFRAERAEAESRAGG